ncbi:4-alpha-glucanotransferase [Izhakiella australiensis]|uniref:4-alpha-glucanotransferase n=1 Tax=Izhakiella australiensis TaxID=1926881 RepID=A0A1S8YJT6_9GAMM|nr:4-alpha-glucanotransferase [Izhakiella australiensis]OON39344.1 4-alpha-glucanotransferase [Izhakiella australiensis]
MNSPELEQAALAAGIATQYRSAKGEALTVSDESITLLLAAMARTTVAEAGPLPPVKVFTRRRGNYLTVSGAGDWQLVSEQGRRWQGSVQDNGEIKLPDALALGYHQLTLTRQEQCWHCRIIIAPARCYQPAEMKAGEKRWGVMVQLYTLRSATNWGMGDFGDLQQLIRQVAGWGGDFIGLNPLHALYPALPEQASPYSPSSRRWLNISYIEVPAVEDFLRSHAAQRWWQSDNTQRQLQAARETPFVDYTAVAALKMTALRHAWQHFSQRREDDDERRAFAAFIEHGGESLWQQSAYDVVQAEQVSAGNAGSDWQQWPQALRHGNSAAVKAFCQSRQNELRFYQWLQWLAQRQYDRCWQVCRQSGMTIGLYRDLAVGVAQGGSETWCDRELYCMAASVGAPPDPLGPLGQNWCLPPVHPQVLQARGYQPFIDLLRANMASSGALRIDHVMSMLRLWWVPQGKSADYGAYVRYPVDDLLAILALESQRHHCMVIGEDLGTVPQEIVSKLRRCAIYSWKVLWFEQTAAGRYRPPSGWARQAIASASTHDLPTLEGFWTGGDLQLGAGLGMYPDAGVYQSLLENRARQKQALLNALHQAGCLPSSVGKDAGRMAMSTNLRRGMHLFLAQTESALLGLQPEDWLAMHLPVNVPGTVDEYPNWRRKLSQPLEAIFANKEIKTLVTAVDRRRRQKKPQR